jgi:DNA primase
VDLARIRVLVPLDAILNRYGILQHLKRAGSQLRGPCSIHNGSNTDQFVVNLNSNTWYCFGDCERGGGTLEFVSARERLSIPHAAQLIADWFNLGNPPSTPTAATSHRRTLMNGRPSHRAYVVEDREGDQSDQPGFWTRIGSAWPHKDGKGLNIQLIPGIAVSGRLILREYADEDLKADEGKRKPAKK